ncbi:MAG: MT-A70 family methyltransferase [Phycisphaerae bacterium]
MIDTGTERIYTRFDDILASGRRYGTIYADPPWRYHNRASRGAADKHYPTMTVDEICALPIGGIAATGAHLYLWVTNAFLFNVPKIMRAWGFEYRPHIFAWCKPQMGVGNYWRVSHELCVFGSRPGADPLRDHRIGGWGVFPRGRHSEKPEQVREFIEAASPGPRIELFARNPAPGWSCWGNQIESNLFRAVPA